MRVNSLLTVLSLTLCSGCAGRLISNAQEVSLGRGVDAEIRKEYRLVSPKDPVAQWAKSLVAPLARASNEFRPLGEIGGYKVAVIADDDLVNAFAAPGGFTYVTTGLILRTDTCAEIAGVMGHELAHITQRHSAKAVEKALAVEQLAALFLEEGLAQDAATIAWRFIQSTKLSRDDETEADDIGLQITYLAGYDPYGLIVFFEKLALDDGPEITDFFSSHPATSKRLAVVAQEIESRYGDNLTRGDPDRSRCKTKMSLAAVQKRIRSKRLKLDDRPVRAMTEPGTTDLAYDVTYD